MAKRIQPLLLTIFFLVVFMQNHAQSTFSNEVGVFGGIYNLRSDFGERQDLESSTNIGFSVGLTHYLNFWFYRANTRESFFRDHFKVKSEISYNETELKHYGKWIDETRISENAERLRSHTGKAKNFNIGSQLEFHFYEIGAFEYQENQFSPFVSLGFQFTFFQPEVYTTYNGNTDIADLDNFYLPWQVDEDPFLSTSSDNTFSIVGNIGTRYKLGPFNDLVLEMRWQYYFSDFVDGLNHKLKSNKSNDWAIWLTLGYVIYWER